MGRAAAQLGIEKQNIADFAETVANLVATTDSLSAEEASMSLARFANITRMSQDEFRNLGSAILALGSSFATTEHDIIEMGLRIAKSGAQIGMTEAQILAYATALSSAGVKAEAGGGALSRIMMDMASQVATGGSKLKEFARIANLAMEGPRMTAKDFAEAFKKDAASALETFIKGLDRLEEEGGNIFVVLENLNYNNIRTRDAFLALSAASKILTNALGVSSTEYKKHNFLTEAAQKRYDTAKSRLILFKNVVNDFAIDLGNVFLPKLQAMISGLQGLVNILQGNLPTYLNNVVNALMAFGGTLAVGGIIKWLGGATKLVAVLKGLKGLLFLGPYQHYVIILKTIASQAGLAWKNIGLLGRAITIAGAAYVATQWYDLAMALKEINKNARESSSQLQRLYDISQRLADKLREKGGVIPEMPSVTIPKKPPLWISLLPPQIAAKFVGEYEDAVKNASIALENYNKELQIAANNYQEIADNAGKAKDAERARLRGLYEEGGWKRWYAALGEEQRKLADDMIEAALPAESLMKKIDAMREISAPTALIMQAYGYELLEVAEAQKILTGEMDSSIEAAVKEARAFASLRPSRETIEWMKEIREFRSRTFVPRAETPFTEPFEGYSRGLSEAFAGIQELQNKLASLSSTAAKVKLPSEIRDWAREAANQTQIELQRRKDAVIEMERMGQWIEYISNLDSAHLAQLGLTNKTRADLTDKAKQYLSAIKNILETEEEIRKLTRI